MCPLYYSYNKQTTVVLMRERKGEKDEEKQFCWNDLRNGEWSVFCVGNVYGDAPGVGRVPAGSDSWLCWSGSWTVHGFCVEEDGTQNTAADHWTDGSDSVCCSSRHVGSGDWDVFVHHMGQYDPGNRDRDFRDSCAALSDSGCPGIPVETGRTRWKPEGGGREMAKSRLTAANKKIEKSVTEGFAKINHAVVDGYTKIEDAFVDRYLTRDGETVGEAKERLKQDKRKR